MDAKPKVQMAFQRFLSRGGGFFGSSPDKSLEDLGLQALVPTHSSRQVVSNSSGSLYTSLLLAGRPRTSSSGTCAR